ncbi:MAG: cytochrome b N-terminal domain-containing protein [Elusimicrobia bacterium]|nr:cytochrome b N-terminal domain-containing protein [Elusimicrobiota bacterium]
MPETATPPQQNGGGFKLPDFDTLKKEVIDSQIWRSMFRGGVWKDTPRDRAAHIIGNVWLHLHPVKVRPRALHWTYTWGLGGISFMLFLILTVTGVLLMFYYRPTVDLAYRDMKDLEFAVTLGVLMRNMHRWAAQAMVVFVILHMVRVFLTGAYKKPREFNWGIGVILLTLTLFLSFTGYLLPWDQLAIWAVTVGTNMAGATPFLGNEGPFGALMGMRINNDVRFTLLGGTMVGENTLIRFYVLHCVAVPLITGILLIVHFWRVRKDSFSAAPIDPAEEKVDVWPNLVGREYIAAAGCLLAIMIWSILMNAPLEIVANPNVTPNPSKAPWYFVGLQELLVYFDPWIAGVVMPNLIIVGLMAIPYIDTNPKGIGFYSLKERPFANAMFLLGVAMWFILIYIGYYCRGPNFAWFNPWESWLNQKPAMPPTWNIFGPLEGAVPFTFKMAADIVGGRLGGLEPGVVPNLMPGWLGAIVLGGMGGFLMIGPKLIQKDIPGKTANLAFIGAMAVVAVLGKIFAGLPVMQGLWLVFFAWTGFYFGFLLPQRHIRQLEWPRYLFTMFLVLNTVAVPLKMGARLAFNVKYVLTFPTISLNI